jgi:hypothetical protein
MVRYWFTTQFPSANIGIVTGKVSGLTVIDIDTPEGKATIEDLTPDSFLTPRASTPSGGEHIYCSYQDGVGNAVRFTSGCDIRSEGGYVMAPPSRNGRGSWHWMDGCGMKDVPVSGMPDAILNLVLGFNSLHLKDNTIHNINTTIVTGGEGGEWYKQGLTFTEGTRDDNLFTLANHLVRGGMPQEQVYDFLTLVACKICDPPFPLGEVKEKVKSALKRDIQRTDIIQKTVAQEVREFIAVTKGKFTVTDVQQWVMGVTRGPNKALLMALSRLCKEGVIERLDRPGHYRIVDVTISSVHIRDVKEGEPISVKLPFGLERYVTLYPGNLIIFAGVTNAGKSAMMFDMIRANMSDYKCWYFSTEMNKETVKKRLSKLDRDSQWDFEIVEDWNQEPDTLRVNDLNFLDWIEAGEEPYKLADKLSKLQKKMKKGLAIAALQKNPNNQTAIGGFQTKAKASLYITIDPGEYNSAILRVTKAKAFEDINPNGFVCRVRFEGLKMVQVEGWGPEMDEKYKAFSGNKSNR